MAPRCRFRGRCPALCLLRQRRCTSCSADRANRGRCPAHHAAALVMLVLSRTSRTPARGYWAMCSIPAHRLARQGARVAHVFVATSIKALCTRCPASPVRTAAVPDVLARPHVSSTSAPTVLPAAVHPAACPAFHATVLASARSPSLIDETRPVGGATRRRVSTLKVRGPRCGPRRESRLAGPSRAGCAGPAAVRTASPCPVASRRLLASVSTRSSVTLTRSRPICSARCWTQRRPPAGSSRRWPAVPSGRVWVMACWSTARVPPVAGHRGHGDAVGCAHVLIACV